MNFIFLQPELREKNNSHFYQYINAICKALNKLGHKTAVVANEVMDGIENGQLYFKNRVFKKTDPVSVLWRIVSVNLSVSGEFEDVFSYFAGKDGHSVFFVDTVLNDRVIALATAFKRISRKYPSVTMVVVFRFTYRSNSVMLTAMQRSLHRFFVFILKKQIRDKRCLLITDSELLKKMYEETIAAPVAVFPIPLQTELYADLPVRRKASPHKPVIGFIGGASSYKGLAVYLNIIAALKNDEANYSVHGINGIDKLMTFARPLLSEQVYNAIDKKRELITTYAHLDEAEYLSLFLRMDIIIIPYSSLQFSEGTSNIFTEALASGVVPLVPRDTWMAAELEKFGMQTLIIDLGNVQQMRDTLVWVLLQRYILAEKMEAISWQWRNYHDSSVFASKLTDLLQ